MRRVILFAVGGAMIVGAIAVTVMLAWHKPELGVVTSVSDATLRNPLEIEAMRARAYPGGTILIEEDLGVRGTCRTYIVSYPSDGLTLRAMMSVPPTAKPAVGYPTLMLNHGYIDPKVYRTPGTDYQGFINYYCGRGYLVFKPDYRGHDQSQGTAEGGHFSPVYTYDVLNLLASIKKYDQSSGRACMMGHSMGAHVTMRAIAVSRDIVCSLMVSGVVGSAEDIVYNWHRTGSTAVSTAPPDVQTLRERVIKSLGTDRGKDSLWYKVSAINYLQDVGPVQIDYGMADTVVPNVFSQHMDGVLTANNRPHETYSYVGQDHQFGEPTARDLFLERSLAFLNTNLNQ